jgi:hypothetical protein
VSSFTLGADLGCDCVQSHQTISAVAYIDNTTTQLSVYLSAILCFRTYDIIEQKVYT